MIVTRPRDQARELVRALRDAGFEPVECPLIAIEPIDDGPIDVDGYDWVVVTSANGAEQLARRRIGELRAVAAIGSVTAAVLERRGIRVDFVPSVSTQEGLVAEFPRPAGHVLFVGAEEARRLLVDELGAEFRPVYRTRRLRPDAPPQGDLVVLASPSAAEAYGALRVSIPAVTIGPQTTAAARTAAVEVAAEARTPDVAGIVAAVREATE